MAEQPHRIDMHEPVIDNHRLFAFHDHACCVCHEWHSVYQTNTGEFHPCWKCQQRGWRLAKVPRWVPRWLQRIVWGEP
jgi:hypothetical protein